MISPLARGYFASRRFKTRNGDAFIDEIALNPTYFAERTTKEILSTLAHEMVHVWEPGGDKTASGLAIISS